MGNAWQGMDGEIPLDVAKQMIVTSLSEFDPALGRRAAGILYNDDRLNVFETPVPITHMEQCRPRGVTVEELKAVDMYIPDEEFAKRFHPHFTERGNDRDYAVVDFEYTYTAESVHRLAHEVGHAIADDVQKEYGRGRGEFSQNQFEEQAYFVQSIVAQAVSPAFNSESASLSNEGGPHISGEFNRSSQRFNAYTAYEQASVLPADQRSAFVLRALGGVPSNREPIERTVSSSPDAKL